MRGSLDRSVVDWSSSIGKSLRKDTDTCTTSMHRSSSDSASLINCSDTLLLRFNTNLVKHTPGLSNWSFVSESFLSRSFQKSISLSAVLGNTESTRRVCLAISAGHNLVDLLTSLANSSIVSGLEPPTSGIPKSLKRTSTWEPLYLSKNPLRKDVFVVLDDSAIDVGIDITTLGAAVPRWHCSNAESSSRNFFWSVLMFSISPLTTPPSASCKWSNAE